VAAAVAVVHVIVVVLTPGDHHSKNCCEYTRSDFSHHHVSCLSLFTKVRFAGNRLAALRITKELPKILIFAAFA